MAFDGALTGSRVQFDFQSAPIEPSPEPPDQTALGDLSSRGLREMAARLSLLADELERPEADKALPASFNEIVRIERRLAAAASRIYRDRRKRRKYLSADLLGEPAWDILLDLFIQRAAMKRVSVQSACLASAVPATTGLRWISVLQAHDYVERIACPYDRRVTWLDLTDRGYLAIGRILQLMTA